MRHTRTMLTAFRESLACVLCLTSIGLPLWSQQAAIAPQRSQQPTLWRPYVAEYVPSIRLSNSPRLRDLVRAGKLYLTVQDAIALALENNVDVELARYNPLILTSQVRRLEAGGALAGVPTGQSQVGSVQSGQGIAGSQAAAGVSTGGNGQSTGTANTTVTQIGPQTPVLDPIFQDVQAYTHQTVPQANATQSQVASLISDTRNYSVSIQQGFLSGGQVSLSYNDSYLKENTPVELVNPSNGVRMQLSAQHNFLQGFGVALNSRNITVAKANLKLSDTTFKAQVITVVANVLNLYYGLVADYQDVRAKQTALTVAQQFYENNQRQVQLGAMAPLDVTTAEAQVASSQQDLIVSQTTLAQQQIQLKNVLSRTGLADPLLTNVEIIPLDRIEVPAQDNLPPTRELIATALANRTDIATQKVNFANTEISNLGTANAVLPRLAGFASATTQGLSGVSSPVPIQTDLGQGIGPIGSIPPGLAPCPGAPNTLCEFPPSLFVGGVGTALGQVFRRNFPSERAGVFFNAAIRNRSAQADSNVDQLSLRQVELENKRSTNQIAVDVSNQVIGLQQARVRYQAAVKNRDLSQQLLDAEQKKFALGVSTTFNVVTQQRDLTIAQSNEVASLVAYSNARVSLYQTLGTILDQNSISVKEALDGRLSRRSVLPVQLPDKP
ncbi:MAG: TolC family protein [Acidobacteriaceae bacterium]|nr:TolC family protein [Acidobacteriaceae bacterium]